MLGLCSQLQSSVRLAIAVVQQGIPIVNPEVHLERIPGELEVYHGGSCFAIKCLLIGRGPEPEVVVVKCPKYTYDQSGSARVRKIFENEARQWRKLNHPNVLPLIGLTYGFGPIPCLITPWMKEGSLTDFIHRHHGQLTTEQKFIILYDIASGLRYLHDSGIIHGDLTGSNVLVDHNGQIYISDFGLSYAFRDADESIPSSICAHRWAALELFIHPDAEDSKPVSTTSCDIYSYGCIVWQVLSGQIPFSHVSRATHVIILKYQGKDPLDERPLDLPERHWEFLQSTWSKKPESRPSSDQVVAFMEEELERFL
ncbi:Protein kinase-like domain containing protein [Tylopilus felleus]|jgi:serine/threonine protein kinase